MASYIDELQAEAAAAIEAMRAAALHARASHAKAELLRHMRLTAAKTSSLPRDQAVATVVGEWLRAWHLPADAYPEVAAEMRAFTAAVCGFVADPGERTDGEVRQATAALEAALARSGTTLADQMAWRSQCAHGWWELVAPVPADLPGRSERPGVPRPQPGRPFWEAGCAPHCLG